MSNIIQGPGLRGRGLRSTGSNSHEMTFGDYARTATANLEIDWTEEELQKPQVIVDLI